MNIIFGLCVLPGNSEITTLYHFKPQAHGCKYWWHESEPQDKVKASKAPGGWGCAVCFRGHPPHLKQRAEKGAHHRKGALPPLPPRHDRSLAEVGTAQALPLQPASKQLLEVP